jgi:hypothetical protein
VQLYSESLVMVRKTIKKITVKQLVLNGRIKQMNTVHIHGLKDEKR